MDKKQTSEGSNSRMIPGEYEVDAITQEQEGALHPADTDSGAERFEDNSVDEATAAEHRKEGGGVH